MYQSPYQRNYMSPYGNNYGMPTPQYAPQNTMSAPQSQPQPQVQIPMPQQMPPMEMPIQDIKYVNKAQAEAYIVYPNSKVMLIDKDSGIVYVKSADGMGQLIQNDYFRFEKVNADGSPVKPQEKPQEVDFSDFLKKSDLEQMGFVTKEQYTSLSQRLEQIQKQIANQNKSNNR